MGNAKTRIDYEFAGGKLKDLREQKELSRTQLAKILNVDKSLIGKWENKKCKPSFENTRELSYFFGVDDDYWKLYEKKTDSITTDKSIEYRWDIVKATHGPAENYALIKDLTTRIVYLEEKIETLTKHDDVLKARLDALEPLHDSVAEDVMGLDNRIDEIEAECRDELDLKLLVKALAKVIADSPATVMYNRMR